VIALFAAGDAERKSLEGAEIDGSVGCGAAAAVIAQVVADDGFVERVHAVIDIDGRSGRFAAAHSGLFAFIGMVIGVDGRIVTEENEIVAVAAIGEADGGLFAERLLHAGPPGFGVLPGGIRTVKLVCAEGVVHVGEGDIGGSPGGDEVGAGGKLEIAVVAVGHKAAGKIAGEAELLGDAADGIGKGAALLIGPEVADSGAEPELETFGRSGDDVDDAAGGIGAVHGGAGTAQHFDSGDGIERHGNIHVVMAGLDVVETEAVEQHQGLFEVGAADGEIVLHAIGRAGLEVERRIEAQGIDQGIEEQRLRAHGKYGDGAIDFIDGERLVGAGHHHGFVLRRGLGEDGKQGKKQQKWRAQEIRIPGPE